MAVEDRAGGRLSRDVSEQSSVDQEARVYRGAGQGVFSGSLAAALTHLVWGLNAFILAFVYGFSMAKLRSWPELAGILAMIGTTVLYGTIYDVIKLDSLGGGLTVGLSVLAVIVFFTYVFTASALVNRARVRALQNSDTTAVDVERSQQWEERYFAPLRSKWGTDWHSAGLYIRPVASFALAIGISVWSDSRALESLAWGVAFFQALLFGRVVQYVRRLGQPSAPRAVAEAGRQPILFLRPFALDALPVSPIGDHWYAIFNPFAWLDKRTFEEHLGSTFKDLGPVIAVGRPGEEVAPLGAAREYADDVSWQQLVLDRAARSQFVIMEVDGTPGMVWELDHVTRLVGVQRILLILPPGEDLFETRSVEWYKRWAALQSRFEFLPEVSEDTAAVLYDAADRPVLVGGVKNSVPRSLAAIKKAWLER
jgi:hypothetical protein